MKAVSVLVAVSLEGGRDVYIIARTVWTTWFKRERNRRWMGAGAVRRYYNLPLFHDAEFGGLMLRVTLDRLLLLRSVFAIATSPPDIAAMTSVSVTDKRFPRRPFPLPPVTDALRRGLFAGDPETVLRRSAALARPCFFAHNSPSFQSCCIERGELRASSPETTIAREPRGVRGEAGVSSFLRCDFVLSLAPVPPPEPSPSRPEHPSQPRLWSWPMRDGIQSDASRVAGLK